MGKVDPLRVCAFDEIYFPVSAPFLQLFFACNRFDRIFKNFEVDQLNNAISFREAGYQFELVLMHSSYEVVCYSDVQGPMFSARQYVKVELTFGCHAIRTNPGLWVWIPGSPAPLRCAAPRNDEFFGSRRRLLGAVAERENA